MFSRQDKVKLAALVLRLGLAFVLAYAAISSWRQPAAWVGYLPAMATDHFDARTLLKIFAVYELILVVWLLVNRRVKYAALLVTLTMIAAIVANFQVFVITFRDVAIACAAGALFLLTTE
jgi:uncharacterized membrane protein YphA (DoxX/SURF4 family)